MLHGPVQTRLLSEPCRRRPNDLEAKRRLATMRRGLFPLWKAQEGAQKLEWKAARCASET